MARQPSALRLNGQPEQPVLCVWFGDVRVGTALAAAGPESARTRQVVAASASSR